jgi:hypothetical protein
MNFATKRYSLRLFFPIGAKTRLINCPSGYLNSFFLQKLLDLKKSHHNIVF